MKCLSGHEAPVRSVDFFCLGDGGVILCSGDTEGVVILWNLEEGDASGDGSDGDEKPESNEDGSVSNSLPDPPAAFKKKLKDESTHQLTTYHLHSTPIRSIRFCGSGSRCVSCDATCKVLVVDVESCEILREFLGGEASCNNWEFWGEGGSGKGGGLLVTASLTNIFVWDYDSGEVVGCRDVPEDDGVVESFAIRGGGSTTTSKSTPTPTYTSTSGKLEYVGLEVCYCTDKGRVALWNFEDNKAFDLTALARGSTVPASLVGEKSTQKREKQKKQKQKRKNPMRGVTFSPTGDICAWSKTHVVAYEKSKTGGDYEFIDAIEVGEEEYGVVDGRLVDGKEVRVVLEDGWLYNVKLSS